MRVKDGFLVVFLLMLAFLLGGADSGGCGGNLFENLADDSTPEAKIEAAKIDLDNGNYAGAIATLQQLCGTNTSAPTCDTQTASLLASAYSGRAGLDVFNVIKQATTTASGAIGSFSTISTLLPTSTPANKQDMHNAVALLSSIPASSRTPNQNLELAIMGAADLIITVGADLNINFDANTGVPSTVPTLTQLQTAENNTGTVTQVSNDLLLVAQGVTGSGLVNESLTNDITDIRNNLDNNPQNGTVTANELCSYLAVLKSSSCQP